VRVALFVLRHPKVAKQHISENQTQAEFSPSIQQLFALSRLSDYRLGDWLAVFGVLLDEWPVAPGEAALRSDRFHGRYLSR